MKRFSDTARFDDEWFVDLPIEFKAAWEYVWAKCDNAGVWNPSFKLADFALGKKLKWDDFFKAAGGRLIVLESGKWMIRGFVEVQCGAPFSEASRPHQAVMALLVQHGISISDSLCIDYPRTTGSPLDKDKDKDSGGGAGGGVKPPPKPKVPERPTREEFETQVVGVLNMTPNDAEHVWSVYEENGWTRAQGGKRIPIQNWKLALNTWKTGSYFPSQKVKPNDRKNSQQPTSRRTSESANGDTTSQYAGIGRIP